MRLLVLMACLLLPTIVSGQPAASGVVEGWILDATGSPLPGVGVWVGDGRTEVARTITATSGRFRLELPAGFYAITAGLPGFIEARRSIQIEPKQTVVVPILLRIGNFGDWSPRPAAGRVVDARGRPVRGAVVTAVLPTPGEEDSVTATTTDAEGQFRLPVNWLDTLIVVAIAEGQMGAAVLPYTGIKPPPPIEITLQPLDVP